jgi:hypothetical protein
MTTGLKIREVWEIPDGNRVKIGLRLSGLGKGKSPLVLLEGAGIFQAAEIAPVPAPDERTSILSISVRSASDRRSLSGRRFRITIIDGQRALEQTWVVGAQGSSASGVGVTPVSSGFTDNPEH